MAMKANHKTAIYYGHVNVGKSTLLGHLLLKMGYITEHEMAKLEVDALRNKKSPFAYVTDSDEAEQASGNTNTSVRVDITYEGTDYTMYDTPGHQILATEFIKAANGVRYHDILGVGSWKQRSYIPTTAVLLVSAINNEFAASMIAGVPEEYSIICRCLGIKNLVVAVNKMDKIAWSDEWSDVREKVTALLKPIGYRNITFVPVSGVTGEGLVTRTEHFPEFPSLLESLQPDVNYDAEPIPSTLAESELILESRQKASQLAPLKKAAVLVQIFREKEVFLTAGWTGVVHYGDACTACTVRAVMDEGMRPVRNVVQSGRVILLLDFDDNIIAGDGTKLIIRHNNKTVMGGILKKKKPST